MSEQEIIGKGTWIDKLAHELLEREKSLGRNLDLLKSRKWSWCIRSSTYWKFR